jgi:hypothetical protein
VILLVVAGQPVLAVVVAFSADDGVDMVRGFGADAAPLVELELGHAMTTDTRQFANNLAAFYDFGR